MGQHISRIVLVKQMVESEENMFFRSIEQLR